MNPSGEAQTATRATTYRPRAIAGFAWFFGTTVAQGLLHIAVLVVLGRLLSPAAFGVMAVGLIVVRIAEFFSRAGVGAALVQAVHVDEHDEASAFVVALGVATLLAGLVYSVSGSVASFFGSTDMGAVLASLCVIFPLQSLGVISETRLQRALAFRALALQRFASFALGYAAISVLTAILGWGVWALVAGQLAQAAIWVILVTWRSPPALRMSAFRPAPARRIAGFAAKYAIGDVGNFIAVQADNIVIGRMLGVASLGYYSRAYQLMALPAQMIGGVLDRVLFPIQSAVQDDRRRLAKQFLQVLALGLALFGPIGPGLSVVAEEVILVVLGPGWQNAVAPFRILAIVFCLRALYRVAETLVRATGQLSARARRQWLYAAGVVAGGLGGIRYGLAGVALGISIALALHYLSMLQLCRSILNIRWRHLVAAHVIPLIGITGGYGLGYVLAGHLRSIGAAPIVVIAGVVAITSLCSLAAVIVVYTAGKSSPIQSPRRSQA